MSPTSTRLAYSQDFSAWSRLGSQVSAHTYRLTVYIQGPPQATSGWIFPRPQLKQLVQSETKKHEGYRAEMDSQQLLDTIWNNLMKTPLGPVLEGLSLSEAPGQRIFSSKKSALF